jgi:hypothetical protein
MSCAALLELIFSWPSLVLIGSITLLRLEKIPLKSLGVAGLSGLLKSLAKFYFLLIFNNFITANMKPNQ